MDKRCIDCSHMYDNNGLNACKWLQKQQKEIRFDEVKKLAEWWNNKKKFEKGAEKYCKGFLNKI